MNAVSHQTGAVRPRYLGSVEAIAAAHAGRPVLISKTYLPNGTPVIEVELPPARQAAQGCGHHCGGHHGPAAPADYGYDDGPYYPGPPPGYNPHRRPSPPQDVQERQPAKPPMFTNVQKTVIVIGVVLIAVMLVLYLVLQLFMAVWTIVVTYGAIILGFAMMLLIAWIITASGGKGGGSGGGGGGGITNITTTITAKTINVGKIFFGR
jgi:hypothetical protein